MTKVNSEYIRSVLDRYGFEKIHKTKNGFLCLCKFHDNINTPAFSISGTNGQWMCWSCGAKGSLKHLHERLGGELSWEEELKMLGAQINPGKYSADMSRKKVGIFPKDFRPYSMSNKPPAYILDRIKWGTITNFKLGNSNEGRNRDRCIIPIYFRDKAVGFHGRALKDGMEPKYLNSYGFDIKDYIFNYDGCEKGKDVIVVEGAFNVMSLYEKGFTNVVATFGTKFTPKQVQLIFALAPENIVICFDRDSIPSRPGQKAAMQLANLTYQLIPTYIMPLPMDQDPNDLSAEVLMECYKKRVDFEKLRS